MIRRRAAEAGQLLQEFLLAHLTEFASQPTLDEIYLRLGYRPGRGLSTDFIVETLRSERDAR